MNRPDHIYCTGCGSLLHLDDVDDLEQATAEFNRNHNDCDPPVPDRLLVSPFPTPLTPEDDT